MASQKFNAHSAVTALKQQWRLRLKKIRQELPIDRQVQASLQACQQLSKRCHKARFVLSFASFGSEINLWPLNEALAAEGRLILPLVIEKKLELFQVTDLSQLECHPWGMLEPKASECPLIISSLLEVALIPGLGFDAQTKYRLGYGQGYYDRLLASTPWLQTWGIGFLEQAVKDLPYSTKDVPLKEILLF